MKQYFILILSFLFTAASCSSTSDTFNDGDIFGDLPGFLKDKTFTVTSSGGASGSAGDISFGMLNFGLDDAVANPMYETFPVGSEITMEFASDDIRMTYNAIFSNHIFTAGYTALGDIDRVKNNHTVLIDTFKSTKDLGEGVKSIRIVKDDFPVETFTTSVEDITGGSRYIVELVGTFADNTPEAGLTVKHYLIFEEVNSKVTFKMYTPLQEIHMGKNLEVVEQFPVNLYFKAELN